MFKYLICALFMLSDQAFADEWRLLEADRLSMDYANIESYRDSFFPYASPKADNPDNNEYWAHQVNLNFDLDLLRYREYGLYWQNRVLGLTTQNQFREVGWQFRLGCKVTDKIDVYRDHLSRHILDDRGEASRFPVYDSYGVEITFYKRDKP